MILSRLVRVVTLGATAVISVGLVMYAMSKGMGLDFYFIPDEIEAQWQQNFPLLAVVVLCVILLMNLGGWLSELWLARASVKVIDQLTLSLLKQAPFLVGAGVCVKDSHLRIVFCNDAFLAPYSLALADVRGQLVQRQFPESVAGVLQRLDAEALAAQAVARTTMPAFSSDNPAEVLQASAMPVYGDGGRFIGMINSVRDYTKQRVAEQAAERSQRHYQSLFENLPDGAAVFRGVILPDGSPDYFLEEANPAFVRLMEGVELPYGKSARTHWPALANSPEFLEGAVKVLQGQPTFEHELFSIVTGRQLRVTLVWLGLDRVFMSFYDVTELRQAESRLLQVGDQLRANLTTQRARGDRLVQDANQFIYAVADRLQAPLEWVESLEREDAVKWAESINILLGGMLLYANSSLLPYTPSLTNLQKIVPPLLEACGNRRPDIAFEAGNLPSLVAAESVVGSILKNLLDILSQQPAANGKIKVYVKGGFLDSFICVEAFGLDLSSVFMAGIPQELTEVDWTQASCLKLAAVSRMVLCHGGWLRAGLTESGSVLFKCSLRVPGPG